jgi:hypothetical protein
MSSSDLAGYVLMALGIGVMALAVFNAMRSEKG